MISVLLVALLAPSVVGHSWLTCTDYLESNGRYFSHDKCRAYPRHARRFAPKGGVFGWDHGYDNMPFKSRSACKTSRDDSSYDQEHPMAVYYPGQVIVLTHPTKNHVADSRCTNRYIPDHGNKLYRSAVGERFDLTLEQYYQHQVWDWGVSPFGHELGDAKTQVYPKQGYQNAPAFCENMDKALATYTWTVPSDLSPGRYSFMWAWWFNKKSIDELYTGCFEADVVASKYQRDEVLRSRGQTTALVEDASHGDMVTPATVVPTQIPGEALNGGWGPWTPYGHCSKTCGGGVQRRVRYCNNPRPQNGGRVCIGNDVETRVCNANSCGESGLRFRFTSEWNSGANGQITIPHPRTSDQYLVQLPCAPASVHVWHANDITSPEQRRSGQIILQQRGWQRTKSNIGFTLHFGGCNIQASQVLVQEF